MMRYKMKFLGFWPQRGSWDQLQTLGEGNKAFEKIKIVKEFRSTRRKLAAAPLR
jgi:hypothetical protein